MSANWFDRAIASVAPRAAARRVLARQAFEALTRGYDGAARGRRTDGWRAPGSSADTEIGMAGPGLAWKSVEKGAQFVRPAGACGEVEVGLVGPTDVVLGIHVDVLDVGGGLLEVLLGRHRRRLGRASLLDRLLGVFALCHALRGTRTPRRRHVGRGCYDGWVGEVSMLRMRSGSKPCRIPQPTAWERRATPIFRYAVRM